MAFQALPEEEQEAEEVLAARSNLRLSPVVYIAEALGGYRPCSRHRTAQGSDKGEAMLEAPGTSIVRAVWRALADQGQWLDRETCGYE